jgi:DnaJ like chaperone protein
MLLFVFFGALIGLMVGGKVGLVVGIAAGLGVGILMRRFLLSSVTGGIQQQFIETTFAVMGALCKADGRVTSAEIQVAEQYFDKLVLDENQRRGAREAFNRGKEAGFDLYGEVRSLRTLLRFNKAFLQLFLQIQLSAIAADGRIHEEEHRLMLRVARALGLSEVDVERLEAMLQGASVDPAKASQSDLENAYSTLGVTSTASDAEVKKAYRRLMSKYHPDKFASQGLSENMREVARERVRDIRNAYDTIKNHRN